MNKLEQMETRLAILEREICSLRQLVVVPSSDRRPCARAARIREVVANHYGVTLADLDSHSRVTHLVRPRHVAIYLIDRATEMGPREIAPLFCRDRSGIGHAIRAVANLLQTDAEFRSEFAVLEQRLRTVLL